MARFREEFLPEHDPGAMPPWRDRDGSGEGGIPATALPELGQNTRRPSPPSPAQAPVDEDGYEDPSQEETRPANEDDEIARMRDRVTAEVVRIMACCCGHRLRGADPEAKKRDFKTLAPILHPDKLQAYNLQISEAEEAYRLIQDEYKTICNRTGPRGL